MNVYRVAKDKSNPYVMVDKQWVNDDKVSSKAKGILLYLLSKPDDWQVYEIDIVNHMKDGRDSIRSGIKELISEKYIERKRVRNKTGKFEGYEYTVYEHRVGLSNNGNFNDGKTNTTNNNLTNNNSSNNDIYIRIADAYSFSNTSKLFYNRHLERFGTQPRMTYKTRMNNPMFDGIEDDYLLEIIDDLFALNEDARTLEYLELIIDRYR